MQSGPAISLCPSFDSYSSNKLAEIAARVVEELRAETESEIDDVFGLGSNGISVGRAEEGFKVEDEVNKDDEAEEVEEHEEEEADDEFEFAFVCEVPESSPISADEIFYNGQIRPLFPIFNRDVLFGEAENENSVSSKSPKPSPVRLPLRKLFIEERDPPSCSSSEADELEGILPGTYCVWTPKSTTTADSQGRCKKSNSTGSSKRWKFRDLLNRSNSDGKQTFVFLTPSNANANKRNENAEKATSDSTEAPKVAGKPKAKGVTGGDGVTVLAADYVRKKEESRRRSFLPYRQDLVGFFANVNGLSRNLHPF